MSYCTYNELLTEKLLSCFRIKGFSSLMAYSTFIFCRAMTFIRYIRVEFTFAGLPDCVHYMTRISLCRGSVPYILL